MACNCLLMCLLNFTASHFIYQNPPRRQRPPLKFEKGNFSVNSEKWLTPRRNPNASTKKIKATISKQSGQCRS